MTYTLKLKGKVTAISDLSMTLPGAGKAPQRATPVPRKTIIENGVPVERLYMNAGTFRGLLRNSSFLLVRESLMARNGGKPILDLDDHLLLAKGGVKSEGKENYSPTLQNTIRDNNPHLSLFGCNEPWLKGRAYIGHLVSNVSPEHVNRFGGVRKKLNAQHLEALAPEELEAYLEDDRLNNLRSVLKREKEQLEEEVKKKQTRIAGDWIALDAEEVKERKERLVEVDAEIKAISGQTRSSVSMLLPLDGYEAIPTGAELSSEITLELVNDLEVGLFLLAMKKFAIESGTIGAHVAHGLGSIAGHWSATLIEGDKPRTLQSAVEFTPRESFKVPEELESHMDIASAWLKTVEVDSLRIPA